MWLSHSAHAVEKSFGKFSMSPEKDETKISPEKDDTKMSQGKDVKKRSLQKLDPGTSTRKCAKNKPRKYDSKTSSQMSGDRTRGQRREYPKHRPLELSVVTQWIEEMGSKETREQAMEQLVVHQHFIPNLAQMLCRSMQAISGALRDISMCSFLMNPPAGLLGVTPRQVVNATNAINLFKLVAVHPVGHQAFVESNLINYFKAFIKSEDKSYAFQNLRMASINLLVDLAKIDSPDVLTCFVSSNIMDCLLVVLVTECIICKRGATYVMGKILSVHQGLHHVCSNPAKVLSAVSCLNGTLIYLAHTNSPDPQLMENVLHCYCLLASEASALCANKNILPTEMEIGYIQRLLKTDTAAHYFSQLIEILKSERA